jgi:O-antigen ligase
LLQLFLLGALILFEQRQWSPAQRLRSCALMLSVATVIVIAVPSTLLDRATSYGTDLDTPGAKSQINRTQGLWAGLVMAAEHPFFGVGPGNFRWRVGKDVGPHNSYVRALTSGGPALLALYLLLLHRTYRSLRTAEQAGPPQLTWLAKGLRLSVVPFVLFSFFADVWLQPPFYWLVGMSIVLRRHVPPGLPALRPV